MGSSQVKPEVQQPPTLKIPDSEPGIPDKFLEEVIRQLSTSSIKDIIEFRTNIHSVEKTSNGKIVIPLNNNLYRLKSFNTYMDSKIYVQVGLHYVKLNQVTGFKTTRESFEEKLDKYNSKIQELFDEVLVSQKNAVSKNASDIFVDTDYIKGMKALDLIIKDPTFKSSYLEGSNLRRELITRDIIDRAFANTNPKNGKQFTRLYVGSLDVGEVNKLDNAIKRKNTALAVIDTIIQKNPLENTEQFYDNLDTLYASINPNKLETDIDKAIFDLLNEICKNRITSMIIDVRKLNRKINGLLQIPEIQLPEISKYTDFQDFENYPERNLRHFIVWLYEQFINNSPKTGGGLLGFLSEPKKVPNKWKILNYNASNEKDANEIIKIKTEIYTERDKQRTFIDFINLLSQDEFSEEELANLKKMVNFLSVKVNTSGLRFFTILDQIKKDISVIGGDISAPGLVNAIVVVVLLICIIYIFIVYGLNKSHMFGGVISIAMVGLLYVTSSSLRCFTLV